MYNANQPKHNQSSLNQSKMSPTTIETLGQISELQNVNKNTPCKGINPALTDYPYTIENLSLTRLLSCYHNHDSNLSREPGTQNTCVKHPANVFEVSNCTPQSIQEYHSRSDK